jgi:hypothetical protein
MIEEYRAAAKQSSVSCTRVYKAKPTPHTGHEENIDFANGFSLPNAEEEYKRN